jgi:soluble cytochrome b562
MSNELTRQRQVTLFYTQSNERKTLNSTAQTWGELSNEIGESFAKSKVVLQESRLTLENTEAQLPAEPFTLFVFPRQSKAGMGVTKVNKGNYHKADFSPLRTFAKKITGSAPNGKQACLDALDKHYGKTSAPAKAAPAKKAAKASVKKAAPKASAKAATKPTPKAKAESNGTSMTSSEYNNIMHKLDSIIKTIDKATPSMNSKELNSLKDLASSVKGTMQTMR